MKPTSPISIKITPVSLLVTLVGYSDILLFIMPNLDPGKHSMKTLPEDFSACVHNLSTHWTMKTPQDDKKRRKRKGQELFKHDWNEYTKIRRKIGGTTMQWKERLHLTSDPLSSKPPGSCQQHCSARAAKLPRYALGPKKRSGFPFQRRPAAN